jgi:hypothetical protein
MQTIAGKVRWHARYEIDRWRREREITSSSAFLGEPERAHLPNTVVSLTTYQPRIENVYLVIKSLIDQTIQPSGVVLYLDRSITPREIPLSLRKLCDHGLVIKFGYEDLKPHKKYVFALEEFPDSTIITADDDVIYPKDFIETLVSCHRKFPTSVVARRVHRILFLDEKTPAQYREWESEWEEAEPRPRFSLMPTGVGGVLYPAHIFEAEVRDVEMIKRFALAADDIWLKVIEVKERIPVVYVPNALKHPYPVRGSQETALFHENVSGGHNDLVFQNLLRHFDISATAFED